MKYFRVCLSSIVVGIGLLNGCRDSSAEAHAPQGHTLNQHAQSSSPPDPNTSKSIEDRLVPICNAANVIKWRAVLRPESHGDMDTLIRAASTGDNATIQRLIDHADRETGGNNRDTPKFQDAFRSRDAAGWNAL